MWTTVEDASGPTLQRRLEIRGVGAQSVRSAADGSVSIDAVDLDGRESTWTLRCDERCPRGPLSVESSLPHACDRGACALLDDAGG